MERASGNYALIRQVIEIKPTSVIIRSPRPSPAFKYECETSSTLSSYILFCILKQNVLTFFGTMRPPPFGFVRLFRTFFAVSKGGRFQFFDILQRVEC